VVSLGSSGLCNAGVGELGGVESFNVVRRGICTRLRNKDASWLIQIERLWVLYGTR
jgi:hypothetical protein